jgi:hypothetical protein
MMKKIQVQVMQNNSATPYICHSGADSVMHLMHLDGASAD